MSQARLSSSFLQYIPAAMTQSGQTHSLVISIQEMTMVW